MGVICLLVSWEAIVAYVVAGVLAIVWTGKGE